jgi:hypothetical protein
MMPPHCDTLDGPVVKAAKKAFETGNVNYILPWVPKKAEKELSWAFKKALKVRKQSKEAAELADYWFYETAVRLHREGEGAPYTGLKPAGLDWGPVVPRAEKAIEKGDLKEVISYLSHVLEEELTTRFKHILETKKHDVNDVKAAREYVQAELGFVLFSHGLYASITGAGEHGSEETGGHKH